jgi:D-tyrosyl-tRNA(Tyr) deacylase
MRAVVQRVSRCGVVADGVDRGEIGSGLCVFVGIGEGDCDKDAEGLAGKIGMLRVFNDSDGKMNLNVSQAGGSLLIVSQFTLYGDCRKGSRPSYDTAMPSERARALYDAFRERCESIGVPVVSGVFQADMNVAIENDGPVTLLLDSRKAF